MEKELFTVKEVATMLNKIPQNLWHFINTYEIDITHVGRNGSKLGVACLDRDGIEKIKFYLDKSKTKRSDKMQIFEKRISKREPAVRVLIRENKEEVEKIANIDVAFNYNGRARRCFIKGKTKAGLIFISFKNDEGKEVYCDIEREKLLSISNKQIDLLIKKLNEE